MCRVRTRTRVLIYSFLCLLRDDDGCVSAHNLREYKFHMTQGDIFIAVRAAYCCGCEMSINNNFKYILRCELTV